MAEEAPPAFLCPILQDVMSDPVVIATGQTYDRNPIHKWLTAGHRTCPVTGELLPHHTFLSRTLSARTQTYLLPLTFYLLPPALPHPSYLLPPMLPPPQVSLSPRPFSSPTTPSAMPFNPGPPNAAYF